MRANRRPSPAPPVVQTTPPPPIAARPATSSRRNYARWRAISLSLVYVLFAFHILHWRLTGRTMAPLELNEVMYTLELGIVTAGFLFMCLLVLGTLLFGRFFCSWACHIMVLQDLCGWLLSRVGIRAKPIRSRLLLLAPPLTALYMFVWPQIVRAWESRAFPTFHLASDRDGWASFVTDNFWRNLPGPWIIAITFMVCGFVIVYLLGSRTFCTYVCPYGAIFGLADRFSPGRILVNDSCQQCGRCTAVCKSGVRVHREVHLHGMVVNPACMKDLDCVTVCPQNALRYGFSKPALFRSRVIGRFGVPYEFTIAEELLAAIVCVISILVFRGLYGRIPFLLSLAMGAILAYLAVSTTRLAHRPAVRLANLQLKSAGRLTWPGRLATVGVGLLALLLVHSAFVRWHEYAGLAAVRALSNGAAINRRETAATAQRHLLTADCLGLFANPRVERGLMTTAAELGDSALLSSYASRILRSQPNDARTRLALGRGLLRQSRVKEARQQFEWITGRAGHANADTAELVALAHEELGGICGRAGDFTLALAHFRSAVILAPNRAAAHAHLGSVLAELGRFDDAMQSLREALRLDPGMVAVHYNLGTLLGQSGRLDEAIENYQRALPGLPQDADLLNNLGAALLRTGRAAEAEPHLRRALEIQSQHADAHFNLGACLATLGRMDEASRHLQLAGQLDRRYLEFLSAP